MALEGKTVPEHAGGRLLTDIIDNLAQCDPQRCFMSIPQTSNLEDGLRNISYALMARAINKCAAWVESVLGRGDNFPTIATYLDPMDFRHVILIFGAIKANYKMFYSSPRNHLQIQVALLEKTQCDILMTPEEMSETTKAVLGSREMRKIILPELNFFLANELVPEYPYSKTWEQARNDPYLVMHSSGTTGTPKVLIIKQGTVAAHDAFQRFREYGEEPWYGDYWTGKRVLTSFPWVHGGGVFVLSCAIFNSFTLVTANDWPLSGATADYYHRNGNIQAAWYSPSVLQDVTRNSTFLENIARLDNISYAGGILPIHIGKAINERTHLFGIYASTETGILPGEMPPKDEWSYYRYNKRLGHSFRHFAGDMYELIHTRNKDLEPFQGIFYTLPEADTWCMRDLYIPHPTRQGWWRSAGRVDDVVIFSDAKKLNPIPYEAVIEEHPAVATALICGTGRTRPAVLLQPRAWPKTDEEERLLLEDLWSNFDRANQAGPVHGRLIKELVVLTKQDKPMARAGGKDTVQRAKSLELYEAEIEQAYKQAEALGLIFGEVADAGGLV